MTSKHGDLYYVVFSNVLHFKAPLGKNKLLFSCWSQHRTSDVLLNNKTLTAVGHEENSPGLDLDIDCGVAELLWSLQEIRELLP